MSAAFAVVLTSLVGLALIYPLLPFLALALGASPLAVAALLAVDTLVTLLIAPFWGYLSDVVGRRPLLLLALALATLSYPMLAIADSIALLFASRALAGLGLGALPVLTAYVADRTSHRGRLAGVAGVNAAYSFAFVIGPLLLLLSYDPVSADVTLPVALAMLVGLASFLLAAWGLDYRSLGSPRGNWAAASIGWFGLGGGLRRPWAAPLWTITAFALVYAIIDGTLGVWAKARLAWTPHELSIAFLFAGAAAGLAQIFVVVPACRRWGERAVAGWSGAAMLAGLMLLALLPTSLNAYLAMALLGAGVASGCSCLTSLVSKTAPSDSQGLAMGMVQSGLSLARVVGPLWGGFALQQLGVTWHFAAALAVMGLTVAAAASLPEARGIAASRAAEN